MTLIERIQRLRQAAADVEDEDRIKQRTGQLVSLGKAVDTTLGTLAGLDEAVAELRTSGFSLPAEVLARADQASKALRALTATLRQDGTASSTAGVQSAHTYAKSLRQTVEGAWKEKRQYTLPAINEDLVDTLDRSGIDVEAIRTKIEKARWQLKSLESRPLPKRGDIATLTTTLQNLAECGRDITELVDPILTEVIMDTQSPEGARLSAFTPDVLAGLAALGILDRFRVRL
ncbi:hypothetical protein [Kitasatospora cineracea]|uniref:Uncharacterized protein n=1 Tax=Kitasatospora cineracea TaxID=88074 RepID=A0A3N4RLX1_9ACTN|nr:hypothetical protein [Kitasatospora cineracea]RPE31821.1 hypothetical protein EDD38_0058 [Kitasatospora cineracea]